LHRRAPLFPYTTLFRSDGRDLDAADAQAAMWTILGGEASPAQIAAFLVALRMKGESVSELVGFARAMRQAAKTVEAAGPLIDTRSEEHTSELQSRGHLV